MIDTLPKGALKDEIDSRDFKLETLGALPPADFSKGSGLPRPPLKDQNSSDSCVSHAWSYYHWQLKAKDFSCRDLFARIAQSYGAVIRDGGLAIVKTGQATTDEVSDPNPETPQNMRDTSGITAAKESSDREFDSFVMGADIDSIAAAILAYKGVVFGVQGTNEGWQNLTVPEPPKPNDVEVAGKVWGHALYAVDFHMHTNTDGSQEKCIIAVTSWPSAGITEHHIRARYFATGMTFNPWCLIPKSLTQNNMQLIRDNGTIFLVSTDKTSKIGIGNADVLTGFFPTEQVTDGDTSHIPQVGTLADGVILHK